MSAINTSAVSQCHNPDCTESFLADYLQVDTSSCNNFQQEAAALQLQLVQLQRFCFRQSLGTDEIGLLGTQQAEGWGPFECYTDADCSFLNTTCNLKSQRCLISRSWQEDTFILCVMNGLDYSAQQYFISSNNLPSITDPNFVTAIKEAFPTSETHYCVNSLGYAGLLLGGSINNYQVGVTDCPVPQCAAHENLQYYATDLTFTIVEDSCFTNCPFYFQSVENSACLKFYICNWNETLCDQFAVQTLCMELTT